MPDEIKQEPQEGQPTEPEKKEPEKESGEPQNNLDYEKSYKELQSKFNQRDEEIKKARQEVEEAQKNLKNWEKLGAIIENDPDLFEKVKGKIVPKTDNKDERKPQVPDETRLYMRDEVVDKFETRVGIKNLDPEKAGDLRKRIGSELQLMLDPQGTGRDLNELMNEVPLNRLSMYFENAYKLATADDSEEQARLRGLAEGSNNNAGMIGSIPSSSANSKEIQLTENEKQIAKKLGISEKDYAEYKIKQYNN